MSHFNKYIHLERSTRNEVQGFIGKSVLIQPKMDGSNSSIWVDDEAKLRVALVPVRFLLRRIMLDLHTILQILMTLKSML